MFHFNKHEMLVQSHITYGFGENLNLYKPLAVYAVLKSKSKSGKNGFSVEMDKSVYPGSSLKRKDGTH